MGSRLIRVISGLVTSLLVMGLLPVAFFKLPIASADPATVTVDPVFVSVSAGYYHSLAVDEQGRVWAWGDNQYGQLGDGTTTNKSRPILIDDATGTPDGLFGDDVPVVSVAAGYFHSLAVDEQGRVWAWGWNQYGQLGDGSTVGTTAYKSRPVLVDDADADIDGLFGDGVGVKSIAAGGHHSLAVDEQGRVWAWGYNQYGQLGDGSTVGTTAYKSRPVLVDDASSDVDGLFDDAMVESVAAGYYHSLAVDEQGRVWAWGYNGYGQLGDGTTAYKSRPVLADDTNTDTPDGLFDDAMVKSVSASTGHSLAVDEQGRVWAWGRNQHGQLGDGTTANKSRPGLADDTTTDTPDGLFDGAVVESVAAGSYHSLAVDEQGRVWAWGRNDYGQLGNGTNGDGADESRPVLADDTTDVDGLFGDHAGVKSVSARGYHSLAVDELSRVWAWGWNQYGRLGDGTTANKSRPVNIEIAAPQVSIPAGVCIVASLSGGSLDGGYSAAADVTYTWKDTAANPNDPPLQSGSSNMFVPTADDVDKTITVTASGTAWNWQDLAATSAQFDVTTAALVPVSGSVVVGDTGVVGVPVVVKKTGTNTVLGSTTTDSDGGFSFGCSIWDADGWDVVFTNEFAPTDDTVSASSLKFDTSNDSLDVAADHSLASLTGTATDAGTGLEITMIAPFEVEFDTGTTDATNPVSQFMFSGSKATAPSVSHTGYSLGGWWTTEDYESDTEWDFNDSVSESMTLFAKWVENTGYTVAYDLNYDTETTIANKTNVTWTATNLLPTSNPVRVGYRFIGWTIGSAASSAEVTSDTTYAALAVTEQKSVMIYAQWSNLNVDTDNDGIPDLNVDTSVPPDGIPDINIDTDGDGVPDVNVLYRLLGDTDFGVFTGNGVRSVSIDAPYNKFVKLLLDDMAVTASNYTVTEGSTVITLQESYLKTFTNGTYWFTAIFTNGESEHIKLVVNVDDSLTAAAGGSVANSASSRMLLLLPVTALGLLTLLTEHKRWLHRTK